MPLRAPGWTNVFSLVGRRMDSPTHLVRRGNACVVFIGTIGL
jgi:hypothetical protein